MREKSQVAVHPTLDDLRPDGMSTAGFLDRDQTLEQVIERDRLALDLLGYTIQEVADLLGPMTVRAAYGGIFMYTAPNGKYYEVRTQIYDGWVQECPWKDKVDRRRSSGAVDMYFTENGNGASIHIAGLIRHLVESHGFFEGRLPYRVAPETIVKMFGVERVPGSFERVRELRF